MASYSYPRTVFYRCGHHGKVDFWVRCAAEASKQACNLRKVDCPACTEKKRQWREARDKEDVQIGLPPLVGSAKQISWATSIRATARLALAKRFGGEAAVEMVGRHPDAKWWIDHRAEPEEAVCAEWAKSCRKAS